LTSIDQTKSWKALQAHSKKASEISIDQLFQKNAERSHELTINISNGIIDLSKNLVTKETIQLLKELISETNFAGRRQAMFDGLRINTTEDRAVLHSALRTPKTETLTFEGTEIISEIHSVLQRMSNVSEEIRTGSFKGSGGKAINTIVNIGIGGSDLGPAMAQKALQHYSSKELTNYFVSNVDPTAIAEILEVCDPETTLFIVASKTFTTIETLSNANAAKNWIVQHHGEGSVKDHFLAVSTNQSKVNEFGIASERTFGFWDWVGGRYSLGSAIGLSLMIAIGQTNFDQMLAGMRKIDLHFLNEPIETNIPVLLGLISIWNTNFLGTSSHAILPYSQNLSLFPAYLQQLDMESNGKNRTIDGELIEHQTGPVIWGEPGTNGQHAFFQLLHQGTQIIPTDFIGFCKSQSPVANQQNLLISNMLAQTRALAFGRTHQNPHRTFPGNRPSTTILFDELTPFNLGQLIAIYEHKVFTMGCIWNINSFDQYGVELGKEMATQILPSLESEDDPEYDQSTNSLIQYYKTKNNLKP